MPTRKHCRGCDRTLPLDAFQRSARNGVQSRCRECRNAASAEYHVRNREKRAAAYRRWYAENADKVRARYQAQRPERLAAMRERYYGMTPEERRAENRRRYEKDIEKSRAQRRAWYAANAEERAEYMRAYVQANRSKFGAYQQKRTRLIQEQFVEEVDALILLERHDGVCGICGDDVDPLDFHIDHVVPVSRGGEHSYANTQPAHPRCNRRKGQRLPEEMAA